MDDDFIAWFDKEVINLAKQKIQNHTCQILKKGGQYDYSPHGTGVLVKIDQFYFIFSASHVLDKMENEDLYVNTDSGIKPICGAVELTDLSLHNAVDVAYIVLDPSFAKELEKKYMFLPKDLMRKKYFDNSSVYLSMGYPAVNIKADKDTKTIYTGSSIVVHPLAKDNVYEHYKYSKDLHYVLEYSGKGTDMETNKQKKINKDPHGVSGCGLWHISFYQDTDKQIKLDYRLIGIIFERKTKYFVHVANKIEIILLGIQNKIGLRT